METRQRLASWLVVALSVAFLNRAAARACSCAGDVDRLVMPVAGVGGVPTDASVWTLGGGEIRLVLLDGAPLAVTETFEVGGVLLRRWGAPPLQPASVHVVQAGTGDTCDPELAFCESATFTVGAGPTAPAPVPEVRNLSWREEGGGLFGGSSCGETAFYEVHLSGAPGALVLVDIGRASEGAQGLAEADPEGAAVVGTDGRATFLLGRSACERNWDFEAQGDAPFRVAALDAAGRFSGWSARRVAHEQGCGGAAGGGWAAAVIGVWLLRGSRRRRNGR